ncbi:MAG TPA: hypothetical protein VFJ93_07290 [Gaiellaceae bacterium]|nr:hypothetical protein [Gaiellaceae bacterium]
MKRAFVPSSVLLVALAVAAAAMAFGGKKPVTAGFYRGESIRYLDFGPIKLKAGNKVAPIWTVTNGVAAQRNIVDTVPGRSDYTPLWKLTKVTFKAGVTPHLLRSRSEVLAAVSAGEASVSATATVVNCPVLGFGQKRVAGFSAGKTIHYYDLGPVKVAPGNAVLPLVTVTNGVSGQHNLTEETIAPGATDYPPLWGIVKATWTASARRVLLTSYAQVQRAQRAGTLKLAKTTLVVNCPLVP